MDWGQAIAAAVSGVAVIVAAVVGVRSSRSAPAADRVRACQEILAHLHDSSVQRHPLENHIDAEIELLVSRIEPTRNSQDIGLGIGVMTVGLVGIWVTSAAGGWWYLATVVPGFLLLVGVFGFARGLPRVIRDEKGRQVGR